MTNFDRKVINALAYLRAHAALDARENVQKAINTLDDAGVFAALDEQTDYASAEEILAESAAMHLTGQLMTLDPALYGPGVVRPVDPAEWGDTSALDMLRRQTAVRATCGHAFTGNLGDDEMCPLGDCTLTFGEYRAQQGWTAASGLGKLERVPGTDTLRPVRETAAQGHEHVFQSPHSDEVCYGDEACTLTYGEFREQRTTADLPFAACTCGKRDEPSPALHAGTCPVWARHHNLEPTAGQEARRMSGADEYRHIHDGCGLDCTRLH